MKSDRRLERLDSGRGLSGRNDDNSAMLSLKELAARAEPTVSATQKATTDDSGLIDLKKLMAKSETMEAGPPVLFPEAYPFGAPDPTPVAPVVAANVTEPVVTRHPGRMWLALPITLVVSAVVTMGVMQLWSSRGDSAAISTSTERTGEAKVEPATAAVRPVEPVSTPAATVAVEEDAAAKAKNADSNAATTQSSRRPGPNDLRRSQASRNTAEPKAKTEKPSATPSTPCDLRCQLERRMKK